MAASCRTDSLSSRAAHPPDQSKACASDLKGPRRRRRAVPLRKTAWPLDNSPYRLRRLWDRSSQAGTQCPTVRPYDGLETTAQACHDMGRPGRRRETSPARRIARWSRHDRRGSRPAPGRELALASQQRAACGRSQLPSPKLDAARGRGHEHSMDPALCAANSTDAKLRHSRALAAHRMSGDDLVRWCPAGPGGLPSRRISGRLPACPSNHCCSS